MSSSDPSKALLMQHFLKDLMIKLSGMAFHAADTHRSTSEGAARKGWLKERCGLDPRTKFFFRLRNRQKLVRIRFENIWYVFLHRMVNMARYDLYEERTVSIIRMIDLFQMDAEVIGRNKICWLCRRVCGNFGQSQLRKWGRVV